MAAPTTSGKESHCSARAISAIAAIALMLLACPAMAEESSAGITSGIKNLAESLDLITAIKAGKKPTDAIALQTALNGIFDLSAEEAKNLELQLRALDGLGSDGEAARTNYLSQLAGIRAKIADMKADANGEADVEDIVRMAQAAKDWRDAAYAPTIRKIVDFAAVMGNRKAIATAHGRLIAIAKEERKIRGFLAGGKMPSFLKLLKKAQGEIAQATQMNAEARKMLDAPEDEDGGDTVDALMADANGLIDMAYGDFVAMSRLVNR